MPTHESKEIYSGVDVVLGAIDNHDVEPEQVLTAIHSALNQRSQEINELQAKVEGMIGKEKFPMIIGYEDILRLSDTFGPVAVTRAWNALVTWQLSGHNGVGKDDYHIMIWPKGVQRSRENLTRALVNLELLSRYPGILPVNFGEKSQRVFGQAMQLAGVVDAQEEPQ